MRSRHRQIAAPPGPIFPLVIRKFLNINPLEPALQGRHIPAQGSALGSEIPQGLALKGRHINQGSIPVSHVTPFQG